MSPRYHLNLARRPFRRYRSTNVMLAAVLLFILGFGVWEIAGFVRYSSDLVDLEAREQEARVEWEFLGARIREIEEQLERPEAVAAMEEIRFLNSILERKRFSWTRLLREIEQAVPRTAYIVSLEPSFNGAGDIRLQIEARGRSVDALTRFLANLGDSPSFDNITVSIEETGQTRGDVERRIVADMDYRPPGTAPEVARQ